MLESKRFDWASSLLCKWLFPQGTQIEPHLRDECVSPHKYVTMRRIERAKELLKRSSMSVLEIGVRVGYLDAKHFRNTFRREGGVSPMEFRSSQS